MQFDTMKSASRFATLVFVALVGLSPTSATAQQPSVHYQHQANMPPGAIGRWQLLRGGPIPGYFQPVKLTAPEGVYISSAQQDRFSKATPAPMTVGLLVGHVYRFQVTRIPFSQGQEVYPTVEVIDRLYPPAGKKARYPLPIQLTQQELEMALDGKFVTRVIYLEPPQAAMPAAEIHGSQRYFEIPAGENLLQTADLLGRPVAIFRMGSRIPGNSHANDSKDPFFYGSPPLEAYSPAPKATAQEKGTAQQNRFSPKKHHALQLLRSFGNIPLLSQNRGKDAL